VSVSWRSLIAIALVLTVVVLLGYGLGTKGERTLAVGDPAPDAELSALTGGGRGSLADYRGRWVLVNFWASWCEPCREEAPVLQRFHREQRRNGLTVLGVNLDDSTDDARSFVSEFGLTYPQLRDGDGRDRREAYGMTGFPESFLVDPEGRIAVIRRGPVDRRFLDANVAPVVEGESR